MAQTTHAINKFVMIYETLQYETLQYSKEMLYDISIFFSYNQMQIYLVFTTSCVRTFKYLYAITICAYQYTICANSLKIQSLLIFRYVKKSRPKNFLEEKHTMEFD